MNKITNRILQRFSKQNKTQLALIDDVLDSLSDLDGLNIRVRQDVEEYTGLFREWQEATDAVAQLSLDIISASRTLQVYGDIGREVADGQVSYANYVEAADQLGAPLAPEVDSLGLALDEIEGSGILEFMQGEGSDIINAEDAANNYV